MNSFYRHLIYVTVYVTTSFARLNVAVNKFEVSFFYYKYMKDRNDTFRVWRVNMLLYISQK